jgi:hypothetical protein
MKATHSITARLEELFNASNVFQKKLSEVQREILSAVQGKDLPDAWAFVGSFVAPVVAKKYGAIAEQTRNGTWTMKKKDGTRHDTAYSCLRSLLALTNLLSGAGATNKNAKRNKVSPVDRLIVAFEKLSLREQREFIKALPRNV